MDRLQCHLPAIGPFSPCQGWFSAYEQLTNGKLDGHVLYSEQPIGESPENSITRICGMGQDRYQPWPSFWAKTSNAILLGRHGLWRNNRYELCLEANYGRKERDSLREDHFFSRCWIGSKEERPGAWTSIASIWADGGNYYHWLFDGLSRLMVREQLPEETTILVPRNLKRFATQTLDILGLTDQCQPLSGRPIAPERYYFCSPTGMTGAWNPAACGWLKQAFSACLSPDENGPPVFFTRRGVSRVPRDITSIEYLFKDHGFLIVEASDLSVKEQINISSKASAIAGIHGAAMTNLVWAKKLTPVLEIFNPSYLNGCYEQIAFHARLNYQYSFYDNNDNQSKILTWLKYVCG